MNIFILKSIPVFWHLYCVHSVTFYNSFWIKIIRWQVFFWIWEGNIKFVANNLNMMHSLYHSLGAQLRWLLQIVGINWVMKSFSCLKCYLLSVIWTNDAPSASNVLNCIKRMIFFLKQELTFLLCTSNEMSLYLSS